ncbi:hypothetical protein F4679DRAFT_554771 [Xylaria curta]|nr:hypothetical protein F4679DRAFT_554771 [Xylaria curta]
MSIINQQIFLLHVGIFRPVYLLPIITFVEHKPLPVTSKDNSTETHHNNGNSLRSTPEKGTLQPQGQKGRASRPYIWRLEARDLHHIVGGYLGYIALLAFGTRRVQRVVV